MTRIFNPYKTVFKIEEASDVSLDEGNVCFKGEPMSLAAASTLLACLGIPKGYFFSVDQSVAKKLLPEGFERKVLEGQITYMVQGFDKGMVGAIPGWKKDLSILELASSVEQFAESSVMEEGNFDYRVKELKTFSVSGEVFSFGCFLDSQVVGQRPVIGGWRVSHEATGLGFITPAFQVEGAEEEPSKLFDYLSEDQGQASWYEECLGKFAEERFEPKYYINHPWFARLPKSIRVNSREGILDPSTTPRVPEVLHGTSLGLFMAMGLVVSEMSMRSRIKAECAFGERMGNLLEVRDI